LEQQGQIIFIILNLGVKFADLCYEIDKNRTVANSPKFVQNIKDINSIFNILIQQCPAFKQVIKASKYSSI